MKSKYCILCFIFSLSLCINSFGLENKGLIEKYGAYTVSFEESGVAKAKKDALAGALLSAYQGSVFSLLSGDIFSKQSELVIKLLNRDPVTIAEEFQIAGEYKEDNKYTIVVRASFSKKKLEEILLNSGVIIEKIKLPRVLLLISQQNVEDYTPYQWWVKGSDPLYSDIEKSISSSLASQGFPVEIPFVVKSLSDDLASMGEDLDKKEAINIGLEKKADIVIVGKAVAAPGKNKIGNKSTTDITVSVVGFRTETGEDVISLDEHTVLVEGADKDANFNIFEKTGSSLGIEAGMKLFKYWKKNTNKINEVELELSGNNYLLRFVKFKRAVIQSGLVSDIKEKEITSSGSKITAFFKGSPDQLAMKIAELPFDDFGISVQAIGPESISVKFIDPQ